MGEVGRLFGGTSSNVLGTTRDCYSPFKHQVLGKGTIIEPDSFTGYDYHILCTWTLLVSSTAT